VAQRFPVVLPTGHDPGGACTLRSGWGRHEVPDFAEKGVWWEISHPSNYRTIGRAEVHATDFLTTGAGTAGVAPRNGASAMGRSMRRWRVRQETRPLLYRDDRFYVQPAKDLRGVASARLMVTALAERDGFSSSTAT